MHVIGLSIVLALCIVVVTDLILYILVKHKQKKTMKNLGVTKEQLDEVKNIKVTPDMIENLKASLINKSE